MDKVKVVYDREGHTLTMWLDNPSKECICEETTEEIILIKNAKGENYRYRNTSL